MRPSLREILLLVATAGATAVSTTACSAPGSEGALVRSDPFANALSAQGSGAGAKSKAPRVFDTPKEALADALRGRCPPSMVEVAGAAPETFCIDKYEASLVDVLSNGEERPHSPFGPVADLERVRAVSAPDVFPQGYVSAVEAARACGASGKRLCRANEWTKACRGPDPASFGYGQRREPGRCNDQGKNPVISLYGRGHWNWATMNLPVLNQQDNTLSRTGEHAGCTNGYGVYDMVGNLHEWVADKNGTFYGGYYQDVASVGHGAGCGYITTAHEARYHDYSTGFRCCVEVAGASELKASTPSPAQHKRARGKR